MIYSTRSNVFRKSLVGLALLPFALQAQYCPPDVFGFGVEPICWVGFANVDNASPSTTSAPAYEDFTTIVAELVQGSVYTIRFTGFTDGTPPNYIAANFDWDRDSTFETHVEIGTITGDLCADTLTASFAVPADADLGLSRVRFVKTFTFNAGDTGCDWGSSYGQAEDYTINVSPAVGIVDRAAGSFKLYPNPNNGDMTVVNAGSGAWVDLRVLDIAGRQVHGERLSFARGASHELRLAGQLASGTYMTVLHDGSSVSTMRFVVR